MERLTRAIKGALFLIQRCTPKARWAVLYGWPDHEDSVLALERALRRTDLRRVVLLVTDPRSVPPEHIGARTRVLRKGSPAGVLAFVAARYVLFTHRCFLWRFPRNVVSVNVWHGMPIKRIGWDLPGDRGIDSSHALATSRSWATVVRRSMCRSGEVLVTGLPRNDRLVAAASADRARVRAALGLGAEVDRLVVWLPTYRRSVQGMRTIDGHGSTSPFGMEAVDPEVLDELLIAHRSVLLVKPHPLAAPAGRRSWQALQLIDDGWLRAKGISLYELLGVSDALISDVSSVVVDYLLADRPIVHAMDDLESYRSSRGFAVGSVEDHLAGPVATTTEELVDALRPVLRGEDPDAARRRQVRDRSHDHLDGGASERVLDAIGLSAQGG